MQLNSSIEYAGILGANRFSLYDIEMLLYNLRKFHQIEINVFDEHNMHK